MFLQGEEGGFEAILPAAELEAMYDRICKQELEVRGGLGAGGGTPRTPPGRRAPLNTRLAAALGLTQVFRCPRASASLSHPKAVKLRSGKHSLVFGLALLRSSVSLPMFNTCPEDSDCASVQTRGGVARCGGVDASKVRLHCQASSASAK